MKEVTVAVSIEGCTAKVASPTVSSRSCLEMLPTTSLTLLTYLPAAF
jgi:hypothetical protein